MEPEQLALIKELPDYLQAKGFEPDIFFHEAGGRGSAPLEDIVLYLQPHIVSGVIGGAAWAAIDAMMKWARKRFRHVASEPDLPEAYVSLNLYSGEGTHLSHLTITAGSVEHHFIHSAVADQGSDRDASVIVLQPNSQNCLAVATSSGSVSCMVKPGWIGCETPAENWPSHEDGTPFHGVAFDAADGSIEWADGQIGNMPRVTIDHHLYSALGWVITAVKDGLRFTNERTGRGVIVTPQSVEGF